MSHASMNRGEVHKPKWVLPEDRPGDVAPSIADLAIDNFHEMKDHVASENFQKKRQLEMALEQNFPNEYNSKYSLVTFKENVGYRDAMILGRAQDKAILNMLADKEIRVKENMEKEELKRILDKINQETAEILEEDRIARSMN